MDVVGFLNRVTGGHLLAWKVVLASVVVVLAGLQVFLAAGLFGRTRLAGPAKTASVVHRWNGRVTLVLAVIVALACMFGPAGPTSPTRVLLHSLFGTLLFVVMAAKFTVLRITKAAQKYLPLLGISMFLTFGAIWATSVADYISAR